MRWIRYLRIRKRDWQEIREMPWLQYFCVPLFVWLFWEGIGQFYRDGERWQSFIWFAICIAVAYSWGWLKGKWAEEDRARGRMFPESISPEEARAIVEEVKANKHLEEQ
ncbi:MAG: hypothetical protein IH851_02945 [Armatimonadetes bacterium]|nr:hypothetical protein [Armatimonadota bacterium]